MTEAAAPRLELNRADGGSDLWAAIEAAQYAKIVDRDPPRNDAEATEMSNLLSVFSDCSENWERQSASDQKIALERLDNRLNALREIGLFVYAGITQARFDTADGETVDLPLAVVVIRREYHQSIEVALPQQVGIG